MIKSEIVEIWCVPGCERSKIVAEKIRKRYDSAIADEESFLTMAKVVYKDITSLCDENECVQSDVKSLLSMYGYTLPVIRVVTSIITATTESISSIDATKLLELID